MLACETAVEAGSVAVFENGVLIYGAIGEGGGAPRGEEALDLIKRALEKSGVEKSRVRAIVASNGPGSFTGARVGAATALGLSKSVGCALYAVSILEAMAFSAAAKFFRAKEPPPGAFPAKGARRDAAEIEILAAIPFGGGRACRQKFTASSSGAVSAEQEPQTSSVAELPWATGADGCDLLVLQKSLSEEFIKTSEAAADYDSRKIIDIGRNLGAPLGEIYAARFAEHRGTEKTQKTQIQRAKFFIQYVRS